MRGDRRHLPSIPAVERRQRVARTLGDPDRLPPSTEATARRCRQTGAPTTPTHVHDASGTAQ